MFLIVYQKTGGAGDQYNINYMRGPQYGYTALPPRFLPQPPTNLNIQVLLPPGPLPQPGPPPPQVGSMEFFRLHCPEEFSYWRTLIVKYMYTIRVV